MEENKPTELSDQELLDKRKKIKSTNIMNAIIIGLLVGVTVYGAVKNDLGFFTFFPLFLAFFINKSSKANKAKEKKLEEILKSRNL